MTKLEPRWYGVSTGNGNDGVSHMFANYYVFTDDPWLLAHAATIDNFEPGPWRDLAVNADVDGEADYTISAVIYEGPEGETEFGAAVFILEVFPADDEYHQERRDDPYRISYNSIEEAQSPEAIALARP